MADHFFQNFKQSISLSDMDPNIEFINPFSGLSPSHQETSALYFQDLIGFPHDNILPQLSGNLETFPGLFVNDDSSVLTPFTKHVIFNDNQHRGRKRKASDISTPESSSANTCAYSSPQVSDSRSRKTSRAGRGKKAKGNEEEDEKPREVIHVRAKRGQATDSHSLAERVRRGKINERLRCLQDIVPGCYKTMGMAVMLDEIINYVQSLQNQVEFLSMKLTAASTFYDFNSDTDAMEAMQRAKTFEALESQNVASQQELPSAQFDEQLGMNFGYCPQLPHGR